MIATGYGTTITIDVDEYEGVKAGDIVTAYRTGYYKVVKFVKTTYSSGSYTYAQCVKVMDARFREVKGKKVWQWFASYCKKVEVWQIEQQRETAIHNYNKLIDFVKANQNVTHN